MANSVREFVIESLRGFYERLPLKKVAIDGSVLTPDASGIVNLNVASSEQLEDMALTTAAALNDLNERIPDVSAYVKKDELEEVELSTAMALNDLDSRVEDASFKNSVLAESIDDIRLDITDLGTSISYIDSSIAIIDASISALDASISALDASVKRIDASVKRIDTSINRIDTSISRIDTSVRDMSTYIADISTRIDDNELIVASALSDLDSRIEDVSSRIGGGSNADLMTNVTYSELKALRDSSLLVPGMQYRITDYECTTTQKDASSQYGLKYDASTISAGHAFDIIVTADSSSMLSENAKAAVHAGDTYFSRCNLGDWELGYSIDNDTSLYKWADASNGKGVIHYMKDEFDNEAPYDFKNIQFVKTFDDPYEEDASITYTYYTFSFMQYISGEGYVCYDYSIPQERSNGHKWLFCHHNSIAGYYEEPYANITATQQKLSYNIMVGSDGQNIYNVRLANNCNHNYIAGTDIIFDSGCSGNVIGSVGDGASNQSNYEIHLGKWCSNNVFPQECRNIIMHSRCTNIVFSSFYGATNVEFFYNGYSGDFHMPGALMNAYAIIGYDNRLKVWSKTSTLIPPIDVSNPNPNGENFYYPEGDEHTSTDIDYFAYPYVEGTNKFLCSDGTWKDIGGGGGGNYVSKSGDVMTGALTIGSPDASGGNLNVEGLVYTDGSICASESIRAAGNDLYVGSQAGSQCHQVYDSTNNCIKFIFD